MLRRFRYDEIFSFKTGETHTHHEEPGFNSATLNWVWGNTRRLLIGVNTIIITILLGTKQITDWRGRMTRFVYLLYKHQVSLENIDTIIRRYKNSRIQQHLEHTTITNIIERIASDFQASILTHCLLYIFRRWRNLTLPT